MILGRARGVLGKVVAAVGGLVVVGSCAAVPQPAPESRIAPPHVVAADHLELGRGIGRAQAADRICELAEIFAWPAGRAATTHRTCSSGTCASAASSRRSSPGPPRSVPPSRCGTS